ncbi:MAG: hypothetical protein ACOX8R_09345 [Bacillota bacterium]|jgi:hypothetical protein
MRDPFFDSGDGFFDDHGFRDRADEYYGFRQTTEDPAEPGSGGGRDRQTHPKPIPAEKTPRPGLGRKGKTLIVLLCLIPLLIPSVYGLNLCHKDRVYRAAEEAIDAGDYEGAYALLQGIRQKQIRENAAKSQRDYYTSSWREDDFRDTEPLCAYCAARLRYAGGDAEEAYKAMFDAFGYKDQPPARLREIENFRQELRAALGYTKAAAASGTPAEQTEEKAKNPSPLRNSAASPDPDISAYDDPLDLYEENPDDFYDEYDAEDAFDEN